MPAFPLGAPGTTRRSPPVQSNILYLQHAAETPLRMQIFRWNRPRRTDPADHRAIKIESWSRGV